MSANRTALARIDASPVEALPLPRVTLTTRQRQAMTLFRSTLNLASAFGKLPPEASGLAGLDAVTVDDFNALAMFFAKASRTGRAVQLDPSTCARLARVFKLLAGDVHG